METPQWLVIVNVAAGAGKAGADWDTIDTLLKKYDFQYHTEFTDRRLHAMKIARDRILEGYRKIIVVGGDGTMNEVINGVFKQDRVPTTEVMLGMIAVGTGNDWSKMFGIPRDYEEAVQTIRKQKTFIQDAGLVSYRKSDKTWQRYFLNIAGMGFGARVVARTNKLKDRGISNPTLYLLNIFTSLLRYRSVKTHLRLDDSDVQCDVFSLNIGIGKYNGGGMMQVPHAIADDGLYSITLIKKMGKLNVLANLKRLYNGKITNHSKVEAYTARTVTVNSPTDLHLETDGETLGHAPLEFRIIPRSLQVITNTISA